MNCTPAVDGGRYGMNRRTFLKAIPFLSAIPFLPFKMEKKEIKSIADYDLEDREYDTSWSEIDFYKDWTPDYRWPTSSPPPSITFVNDTDIVITAFDDKGNCYVSENNGVTWELAK